MQVLAEISCGKDQFDEIVTDVVVEEEPSLLAAAREVKAEKKSERKSVNPSKMSDFKKERASKALLRT